MTIWRAGMKVVCIDDRPFMQTGLDTGLRRGRVYTVTGKRVAKYAALPDGTYANNQIALFLAEVTPPNDPKIGGGYGASRFRPVTEQRSENKHFASLRDLLTNPHKVLEEA